MKSKCEQYLRERVGIDFPYFSPPKSPDFGGICPAAAEATRLGAALVGSEEEEWEGGGGRGPARAQVMRLSRQRMWRDRGATSLPRQRSRGAALHRAPAWQSCRATCTGATEATCRASSIGAIKRATWCKYTLIWVKIKILLKKG